MRLLTLCVVAGLFPLSAMADCTLHSKTIICDKPSEAADVVERARNSLEQEDARTLRVFEELDRQTKEWRRTHIDRNGNDLGDPVIRRR